MRLVSFGHWYYDHASTMMPALIDEMTGKRSDWGRVQVALEEGETVVIRPASREEHAQMAAAFDERVDALAKQGFISGIGNFNPNRPPPDAEDELAALKARARVEPFRRR